MMQASASGASMKKDEVLVKLPPLAEQPECLVVLSGNDAASGASSLGFGAIPKSGMGVSISFVS
jgi:hypothetical protein